MEVSAVPPKVYLWTSRRWATRTSVTTSTSPQHHLQTRLLFLVVVGHQFRLAVLEQSQQLPYPLLRRALHLFYLLLVLERRRHCLDQGEFTHRYLLGLLP